MASRPSFSDDLRVIKKVPPIPKSLLLRDYLLDDMSSCSSNGFRSYPRRHCCTTVRFLVESDLNRNGRFSSQQLRRSIAESKLKPKPKSKQKQKQPSVMHRASTVMIKAFKWLPFRGAGVLTVSKVSTTAKLLPRSLSRKLLKHGFWKRTDGVNNEVKRLTTFGDLIKQEEVTLSPFPLPLLLPAPLLTAIATAEMVSLTSSSDRWSVSEFTASTGSCSNGNESEVKLGQNDVADESPENIKTTNAKRVGVTTVTTNTAVTATNYCEDNENAKEWQDNQNEQFSPVSVMDFPSENDVDDEDEVSSMSARKHLNVKGTKISAHKTRLFDRDPQLEPVKLEDRIAQSVLESSTTTFLDFVKEDNQIEKKAMALLQLLKSTVSSHYFLKYEAVESLLLEFLKECVLEENVSDFEMLQRAKDWMDGQEEDIFIDWECENNRQTYLREMEKGVKWSNYDHQVEKVNVGLEVECEIFNLLVNDVLTDFNLQEFDHED